MDGTAMVIDRREGPYGEVVLRKRAEAYEIIENGCFLMDTSDGRSERLLIRAALEALDAYDAATYSTTLEHRAAPRTGRSLLIGGLGVGFSLAEATAEPRWGRIAVVEREQAVIDWHRHGDLARFSEQALDDPRVEVISADLVHYLRDAEPADIFDALCLDIDNGPGWTVTESNDCLYAPEGLAACRARLAPGGVLAVWSAQPSAAFEEALGAAGFAMIRTIAVPVARGVPDVVHLAIRPA